MTKLYILTQKDNFFLDLFELYTLVMHLFGCMSMLRIFVSKLHLGLAKCVFYTSDLFCTRASSFSVFSFQFGRFWPTLTYERAYVLQSQVCLLYVIHSAWKLALTDYTQLLNRVGYQ
jgi:hypothetical protein